MLTLPYTIQQLPTSSLVSVNGTLTVPGSVFDSNFAALAQMWAFGSQPATAYQGQIWIDASNVIHMYNGVAWVTLTTT